MLNNYIGGGQVFLHKIRMFMQVFWRTVNVSMLIGVVVALILFVPQILREDLPAAISYRKAVLADGFDTAIAPLRASRSRSVTTIDAKTRHGVYARDIEPRKILSLKMFREVDQVVMGLIVNMLQFAAFATLAVFLLVFFVWNRFGKSIKDDKKIKGGQILTAAQVNVILKSLGMASWFKIGQMPLVKDAETRHFLICGATGSGKTNLIDNILPQIISRKQPAIVVDQTGEMIAKYYDPTRGDIIFNPLDSRSHHWDFWADCFADNVNDGRINDRLEKFAKILFGFNRKGGSNSDPFWENSAETVFTSCADYAFTKGRRSLTLLNSMLKEWSLEDLASSLKSSPASRYLGAANKITASSILSVMTTMTKPLNYLSECNNNKTFSLNGHLKQIKEGSNAWLFLATSPSQRELTLPLIACLLELAVSLLMENGIQKEKKLWFILDELASLGRLPALNGLMSEGRKYGACVIAAMQSLNQLYNNYGQYAGSTIFGQFGTKFFFRNDEPQIARMITDLCGTELIHKQQKNTSFGANEFRDGVSYTEQEKQKPLVEYSDIASLNVGQCYALLPEPKARLAKIEIPESLQPRKNEEFVGHLICDDKELTEIRGKSDDEPETANNQALGANNEPDHKIDDEKLELTR